jgi:hypothetical protein
VTINDPFLDRRHQPLVRDRLKAVGDVRLGNPSPASPGLIEQDLEGVMRRLLRAKAERARRKVGLKDRLNDDLQGRLDDPVTDRGDRQRPSFREPGFGMNTRRAANGR